MLFARGVDRRYTMLAPWLLMGMAASPRIDLYTMGQGPHLFERFGHAAICAVWEEEPRRSRCYNYGTTDFGSSPQALGWGFLRGTARFWVSVSTPDSMLRTYADADRDIFRQRLPLSPVQARWVAERLEYDAREENRYYVYHHLRDNCSTRVRDLIDQATGGALSRGRRYHGATSRDFGRRGLATETPLLLASDLMIGRGADRKLTEFEAMFLPAVLRQAVADKMAAVPERVHARQGPARSEAGPSGRGLVALAALVPLGIGAIASSRPGARAGRCAGSLLKGLAALLGAVAAVLWATALLSRVPELRCNEALLAYLPADLAVPLLSPPVASVYARVRVAGLLLFSLLLALGVLLQPLHVAVLVPLAVFAALATRSVTRAGPGDTLGSAGPSRHPEA